MKSDTSTLVALKNYVTNFVTFLTFPALILCVIYFFYDSQGHITSFVKSLSLYKEILTWLQGLGR